MSVQGGVTVSALVSHTMDSEVFVTTLLKAYGDIAKNTKYNGCKNEIVKIRSY